MLCAYSACQEVGWRSPQIGDLGPLQVSQSKPYTHCVPTSDLATVIFIRVIAQTDIVVQPLVLTLSTYLIPG